MNRFERILVFSAAVFFVAVTGAARIFSVRGAAGAAAMFETLPGWRLLERRAMRINGERAEVEIWGGESDFENTAREWRMAAERGADYRIVREGVGAVLAERRSEDSVLRVLLVQPASGGGRPVAIAVRMKPGAAADAGGSGGLPHLPLAAGESSVFCAEEDDGRVGVELRSVPGSPPMALQALESRLAGDGWRRVVPGEAGFYPLDRGMAIFLRGDEMICVSARAGALSGSSDATVMYKKMTVE